MASSNDHDRAAVEFAIEEWRTKDEDGRRSNQDYIRLQNDSSENNYCTISQIRTEFPGIVPKKVQVLDEWHAYMIHVRYVTSLPLLL